MLRPKFTLKTLLWLIAVVAAFLGGAAWQHQRERPVPGSYMMVNGRPGRQVIMPNGEVWLRGGVSDEEMQRAYEDALKRLGIPATASGAPAAPRPTH